ncbi:DUF6879 family protein [Streptomyces daliensis]|uniref:DUF6879 domain-containing protein n=1 Tax=Streptomyces daliensis TaxID=299421 RepID=A0A8T4IR87_9ACTN|nr:hypothetical protein [Streptomyces daliensis]
MALLFFGKDPNTNGDDCPTVWVDEETDDPAVVKLCSTAFESVWDLATPHEEFSF